MGRSLVGQSVLGPIGEVTWVVFLKLIVQPFITFLLVFYVFELSPFWAQSAIILSALPGATTIYIVAQQYDVYVHRASASILLSTVLSLISVTIIMVLLGV